MSDFEAQVADWESLADEEQCIADKMMEQVSGDAFTLKDLLNHVTRLKNKAEELREKAAKIDEVIDGICCQNLPELFTKMKQEKVICDTFTATLKDIVSAYVVDAEQALPWLISSGAEDLVKTKIKLDLPRGCHSNAVEILKFAESKGASGIAEEGIHQATLTKWVKEEMQRGRNYFPESIKIFQGRKVVFRKRPVRN